MSIEFRLVVALKNLILETLITINFLKILENLKRMMYLNRTQVLKSKKTEIKRLMAILVNLITMKY